MKEIDEVHCEIPLDDREVNRFWCQCMKEYSFWILPTIELRFHTEQLAIYFCFLRFSFALFYEKKTCKKK